MKQSVKIPSCANTFLLLSKWSIPYITSYPLKGCNKLTPQIFKWFLQLKLHKTLIFALILCCSEWGAHQLWCHKIQFWQFSQVSTNCSVYKMKKNTVFKVEYLGSFLTKSCKTLDWLFGLVSFILTYNQTRPNFVAFDL